MVRHWTVAEKEYLEDKWGSLSLKAIGAHLGKSISAVKQKASRLGLADARMSYDGITVNQLAVALNKNYTSVKDWISRYNMPAKRKIFCKSARVLVIKHADFWKWAEGHKELLNLAKMEPNTLGAEPTWVKEKRKADLLRSQRTWQSTAWTKQEDQRLVQLVKLADITYPDLAKQLNRTESSIRRRLYDLNVKFRPARLNNHVKYTPEEVETLKRMAMAGYGYETIAAALGAGKSANGVRGKLERMKFDFKRRAFPIGS